MSSHTFDPSLNARTFGNFRKFFHTLPPWREETPRATTFHIALLWLPLVLFQVSIIFFITLHLKVSPLFVPTPLWPPNLFPVQRTSGRSTLNLSLSLHLHDLYSDHPSPPSSLYLGQSFGWARVPIPISQAQAYHPPPRHWRE